jgi:hypothetical protein
VVELSSTSGAIINCDASCITNEDEIWVSVTVEANLKDWSWILARVSILTINVDNNSTSKNWTCAKVPLI